MAHTHVQSDEARASPWLIPGRSLYWLLAVMLDLMCSMSRSALPQGQCRYGQALSSTIGCWQRFTSGRNCARGSHLRRDLYEGSKNNRLCDNGERGRLVDAGRWCKRAGDSACGTTINSGNADIDFSPPDLCGLQANHYKGLDAASFVVSDRGVGEGLRVGGQRNAGPAGQDVLGRGQTTLCGCGKQAEG